ncbi:MAG TPA: hypothetical protein VGR66_06685 [Candidatus Eisenbacteria bacterium]|nr:hypothetical protein [Candidatus Eisenbacteria bacterium]
MGVGKAGADAIGRIVPAALFLLAACGAPAHAFTTARASAASAAAAVTSPVEIPRPSRAWVPQGEAPTSESWRLRVTGGPGRLGRALLPDYVTQCDQIGADGETEGSDADLGTVAPAPMQAAWRAFTAEPGVRGDVRWNRVTGMPHRAWTSGVRLLSQPLLTQEAVESAARPFLREQSSLLLAGEDASADDLPLLKAHRVGDVWFLVFGQRWHGLEVVDGRVDLRVRVTGEVVLFGSDWFPGVSARTTPLVNATVAAAVARAGVGFRTGIDRAGGADLAILPVPDGFRVGYRLVHRVRLSTQNPPGEWTTYVDAEDGRVWARENAVRWAATTDGGVQGAILPRTWTNAFQTRPFAAEEVWRNADTTTTSPGGDWSFAGRAPHDTVFTRFRSPLLRIRNQARGDVILAGRAHPPSRPLDFEWTDANSDTAERNAYYHALAAHARIKALDPSFTGMDYRVPCNVNLDFSACNAFWDGFGLNFFATGAGCANMAAIADVVIHEYGHGITQHTYDPLLPNPGMNEAFSDYFAASALDDPVIGRDLEGPGTYVRRLENDAQLLDVNCDGEPHCLSLATSGALWDMRKAFVTALGPAGVGKADSLWHFAGYGAAYWNDDYLLDLLVIDDDDGTLLDGTPSYAILHPAFTRHGFLYPEPVVGAWIDHAPIADAEPSPSTYTVSAAMGSSFGALATALLHYRVNGGGWTDQALTASGVHYSGTLPALPHGGAIDYWLEARDGSGHAAFSPPDAPDHLHSFHIGRLRTLSYDDFTRDNGWYPGDDRPNSLGGWRRVDPFGTKVGSFRIAPENDASGTDHVCWVTGDTLNVGVSVAAADIDDGCTSLWSPRFDLSGVGNARVTYWRWFTDEFAYDDTLWIEASGDDGATWAVLEGQPFTQNFWRERSFDLGSVIPLTDRVRIRVTACDICQPSLTEAAFDDISFTTRDTVPAQAHVAMLEPETATARKRYDLALALGSSSPARGPSAIRFTVPGTDGDAAVPVHLFVVDMRGRIVSTLVRDSMRPGEARVTWSGADPSGRQVAPGIYAARLEAGGRSTTLKIVRMP